ncbi:inactive dipeptidyl peptidase 10 [Condylostylus longicornis]|uniref:inactive dipeptidyl peptidase 10 n=1 Tax=Condylostylus longicornis TaxID=2530218 RepID=UPI00244E2044|nr:inactive dipeptidyl peptidase 10 [Condylostylus longicornis]
MNAAQSGGHTTGMNKKGSQLEELVAISPERRNWRGIFIALLVIAAVFSLIIFSIFLLSPEDEATRVKGRRFVLSDITSQGLKWKSFNTSWISGSELVYRDADGGLSLLDLKTSETRILMTNTTFRQLNIELFLLSPDLNYVLLFGDTINSKFYIYEFATRNIFPLTPIENTAEAPILQLVIWAPYNVQVNSNGKSNINNPTGAKVGSQAIAFVYENDIFYKPKVQGDLVCKVTKTGQAGLIYNGVPDWTYSNIPELKSATIAFSTDGQYLSFLSYNDSEVNEYRYMLASEDVKYPKVKSIRYPKTGTKNPNVTVYVVNLSVLKFIFPQKLNLPIDETNGTYVSAMTWLNPTDLSVTVTTRKQTKAVTIICQAPLFKCYKIHTEVTVSDGWVLPSDLPIYTKHAFSNDLQNGFQNNNSNGNINSNGNSSSPNKILTGFLLKRLPVRDGENGHFRQVVLYSLEEARTIPLTIGRSEVTKIIGWDLANNLIYYIAAPERKPGERHLYKISINIKMSDVTNRTYVNQSSPICLTCKAVNYQPFLTKDENSTDKDCAIQSSKECLYNEIYFSKDYSYYIQECLGPDVPSVHVVESESNQIVKILTISEDLRSKLGQLALPQIRTFSVEIRHGFQAQVRLYLPPGMKEDEEIAFPLILQIDASPGSQLVSEKFEIDWNWYLCSQRSFVVAQIDVRGSGFQGELLRTQLHGRLGTVEIEDQLGVLTYLRDNIKFIDPSRICVYGVGYGGYAATLSLLEDSQQILQCAIAINPITAFGHHYSFFTERYIPQNGNFNHALEQADLRKKISKMKSRKYMLIYGTADLVVHQEHSLMLTRALINEDVQFRQQIYPGGDHQLSQVEYHLYRTMEWYIDECFGPLETDDWDPTGFLFKP